MLHSERNCQITLKERPQYLQ